MLIKANPLSHMKSGWKNPKENSLLHFDSIVNAKVWMLSNREEDTSMWYCFEYIYLFDSISSGIVWINRLYDCDELIYFPNIGVHGNKKKKLFSLP